MRRSQIYAVVRTGGKQYKVQPNQLLDVELLPAEVGAVIELSDVLLVADGDDVTVGEPQVAGARVLAEVIEHGRGPKLIVFKYKPKTRYRKKTGHRQAYTRLAIRQILTGVEPLVAAAPAKAPAKPRQRRAPAEKAVVAEAQPEAAAPGEQPEAAPVVAAVEPPVAVEGAAATEEAPKTRRRRTAAPQAAAEPAPEAAAQAASEAAVPEEAPKARPRRAAAPKSTEEAPPKPRRRTEQGE